jgi:hypothetical protein
MSKGETRVSKVVGLKGIPPLVQVIPFDFILAITDPGAAIAFASKAIAKVPKGNWALLTAVSNVIIQDVGGVGLIAAFTGQYSFGTTATADNALTGTDRDIIGLSNAGVTYLAAAGITPKTRGTIELTADAALAATGTIQTNNCKLFDNTAGNLNMNFNMTVVDASISANASVRVRGQLNLIHAVLGDG